MNTAYEWLYDNYTRELQQELCRNENAAIENLSKTIPLSDSHKIDLADCMVNLRLQCGTASFALGFQLGLRLTAIFLDEDPLPPPTAS